VAAIARERPDVVLLEAEMAGVGEDSFVKIIKGPDAHSEALILLHSALSFHELHQRSLYCGADGYIQKSEHSGRLVSQIHHWRSRLRGTSQMRTGAFGEAKLEPSRSFALDEEKARLLSSGTKPVVLFVDDDPLIVKLYRREFGDTELSAEFAQSGEQALMRIASPTPPDVVVCDLLMPGMSGAELYQRALSLDPIWKKRFLFTTGFGTLDHISSFIDAIGGRVLRKPVAMHELREAIRYAALTARMFTPRTRGASAVFPAK
jgi:CheY-like chemotaxis protein